MWQKPGGGATGAKKSRPKEEEDLWKELSKKEERKSSSSPLMKRRKKKSFKEGLTLTSVRSWSRRKKKEEAGLGRLLWGVLFVLFS